VCVCFDQRKNVPFVLFCHPPSPHSPTHFLIHTHKPQRGVRRSSWWGPWWLRRRRRLWGWPRWRRVRWGRHGRRWWYVFLLSSPSFLFFLLGLFFRSLIPPSLPPSLPLSHSLRCPPLPRGGRIRGRRPVRRGRGLGRSRWVWGLCRRGGRRGELLGFGLEALSVCV